MNCHSYVIVAVNAVSDPSELSKKVQEVALDNLLSEIEFDSRQVKCYSIIKNRFSNREKPNRLIERARSRG